MIEGFRKYGKDIDMVVEHVKTRVKSSVVNRAYQLKLAIKKDPTVIGADILPILEGESVKKSAKQSEIDEPESNANGPWSDKEHLRMIEGFRMYGKDIDMVVKHVKTRVKNSVINHAYQFKLTIKKDPTVIGAEILPILEGKSVKKSQKQINNDKPESSGLKVEATNEKKRGSNFIDLETDGLVAVKSEPIVGSDKVDKPQSQKKQSMRKKVIPPQKVINVDFKFSHPKKQLEKMKTRSKGKKALTDEENSPYFGFAESAF